MVETHYVTEYLQQKQRDIQGYHPSDITQFLNLTSTTVSLGLIQDERVFSNKQ